MPRFNLKHSAKAGQWWPGKTELHFGDGSFVPVVGSSTVSNEGKVHYKDAVYTLLPGDWFVLFQDTWRVLIVPAHTFPQEFEPVVETVHA